MVRGRRSTIRSVWRSLDNEDILAPYFATVPALSYRFALIALRSERCRSACP